MAATRIWTGGHASSGNWSQRDNWGGTGVPANGDTLVFPSGTPRPTNTNNIAGLRLREIQFLGLGGGFNLRGAGLAVSNGVSVAADAANTLGVESVTFHGSQTLGVAEGGQLTVSSDLVLSNGNLTLSAVGDLSLRGGISGTGNVIKNAAGLATFFGDKDNTYGGTTFVNAGTLALSQRETVSVVPFKVVGRVAVPGNLVVGDGTNAAVVRLNFDEQIANEANVIVHQGASLRLFDFREAVTDLILRGGNVSMGDGLLVLNGGIQSLASSTGSTVGGRILLNHPATIEVADGTAAVDMEIAASIGSSAAHGLIKTGPGTLRLAGTNTYIGPTLVSEGLVRVASETALGAPNGGTSVSAGAELQIDTVVAIMHEPLTLAGAGIGGLSGALRIGSDAAIATNIVLSAPTTIHSLAGGNLLIDGTISGVGPLTKTGPGALELGGKTANTYSGNTLAAEGLLLLSKILGASVPGDLTIGGEVTAATVRHTRSGNVGGAVTVNAGSLYDLDGNSESVDSLTLRGGGDVMTGHGQLTLEGDLRVNVGPLPMLATSQISGRLNVGTGERRIQVEYDNGGLGGLDGIGDLNELLIHAQISGSANIIKGGPGDTILLSSNTFTGTLTVEGGELYVADGHALGTTGGQTILNGAASLKLLGTFDALDNHTGIVIDEPIFLNTTGLAGGSAIYSFGSNLLSGPVFLVQSASFDVFSNHVLQISGPISGPSGLTKIGPGRLVYAGSAYNTYNGTTRVNEGTLVLDRSGGDNRSIPGRLMVGDGLGGEQADAVEVRSLAQISDTAEVTVNDSGALRLFADETLGSVAGAGRLGLLGGSTELATGRSGSSTSFDGIISGSGSLRKMGAGRFVLSGDNSYTGDTLVDEGVLFVNGEQPDSHVYVGANGTLSGVGAVGDLSIAGILRPGSPRGRLDASTINFLPGSTFSVALQHTPDAAGYYPSHNWFRSFGSVDLTGATLQLSLEFAPVAGQTFILGNKIPPGAVSGIFLGKPEGSLIVQDDIPLRLTYDGDTGNDIVLTVGNLPLHVDSTRISAGNGNGRIDPDECDEIFVGIHNSSALALQGVTARLESLDPRIAVTESSSVYGDVAGFTTRTNRTPFQIRVASGYPCGAAVDMYLVVRSANHGPFALPIRLLAGFPGEYQLTASSDVPRVVPDMGVAQSAIDWPNNFRIGKVRVRIHATHPASGHLRFRLRHPSGEEVLLSSNRGGVGNDYGIGCGKPTVFDDDAGSGIGSGSSPFAGIYAPEESLSHFIDQFSAGLWTLVAEDTIPGVAGVLQCWSLELARAVCADGGGVCESCTTRIMGTFAESTAALPERLTGTMVASGCGNVNHCPGTTIENGPYRYQSHAFTNTGPETCVTVVATVPCEGWANALFLSSHLGDIDSADLCGNYLGDIGQWIHSYYGEGSAFSFPVPAGGRFTVLVTERSHLEGCGSYTLELFGLPCSQEQPRLHITDDAGPGRLRLHWSTAYSGFTLQRRPALQGPILGGFTNVNDLPQVVDGHYSVTNTHPGKGSGLFRLHKP